ncbi:MAG: hypothetical protein WD800_00420 [Dehalococcoidia bacterium]
MLEPEILVRVLLGGLFIGGLAVFLAAPENRGPDVPTSVRRRDMENNFEV